MDIIWLLMFKAADLQMLKIIKKWKYNNINGKYWSNYVQ